MTTKKKASNPKTTKGTKNVDNESLFIFLGVVAISLIAAFFVFIIQPLDFDSAPNKAEKRQVSSLLPYSEEQKQGTISPPSVNNWPIPSLASLHPSCIDTDGGDDETKGGTSSFCEKDQSGNVTNCEKATEYCNPSGQLIEFSCKTDSNGTISIQSKTVFCSNSSTCQDDLTGQGAACTKVKCVDSDSGNTNQAWRKGSAVDETNTKVSDACADDMSVNEAICSPEGKALITPTPLPCQFNIGNESRAGKCVDGVCVSSCDTDTQCPSNFACTQGQCIPTDCSSDNHCPTGMTCNTTQGRCTTSFTPHILTCADSDPLNNPYRVGVVTYQDETGAPQTKTDACESTTSINEYSCKDGMMTAEKNKPCPVRKNYMGKNIYAVCTVVDDNIVRANGAKCVYACTTNEKCPKDMICSNGTCILTISCSDNNPCKNGEQCKNGVCAREVLSACEDSDKNNSPDKKGSIYEKSSKTVTAWDTCSTSDQSKTSMTVDGGGEYSSYGATQEWICSSENKAQKDSVKTCEGLTQCLVKKSGENTVDAGACSCVDTDPSDKSTIKGTVFALDTNNGKPWYDTCVLQNTVLEYSCQSNNKARASLNVCLPGNLCIDGVCCKDDDKNGQCDI